MKLHDIIFQIIPESRNAQHKENNRKSTNIYILKANYYLNAHNAQFIYWVRNFSFLWSVFATVH